MTPEAQRIAIAEACGAVWKRQSCSPWNPDDDSRNVYFRRLHFITPGDNRGPATLQDAFGNEAVADDHPIPDYLNDLNAIAEAEKILDVNTDSGDSPRYAYSGVVYNLVTSQSNGEQQPFRATAAQRSEAFLRCLNLWTDDPPAAEVEGKR